MLQHINNVFRNILLRMMMRKINELWTHLALNEEPENETKKYVFNVCPAFSSRFTIVMCIMRSSENNNRKNIKNNKNIYILILLIWNKTMRNEE